MQVNGHDFLVGFDPEGFIFDTKEERILAPSYMWPLGTKKNPYSITSGVRVQRDGVALEFNTSPAPVKSSLTGSNDLHSTIRCVQEFIDSHTKKQGGIGRYKLTFRPVVEFDKDYWSKIPEKDKVLGCDPDFNAWTESQNDVPKPPKETMRTGAGHIHIGWGKNLAVGSLRHMRLCSLVARELDATVGIVSVIVDPNEERRQMYGKAGAFRPKPYGLEYRVPSNVWVGNPEARVKVFDAIKTALSNCMKHKLIHTPDVVDIINNSKTKLAVDWAKTYNVTE